MKNRIVLISILALGLLPLSAQKNTWTIGLYSGIQGQIVTSIERDYHLKLYNWTLEEYVEVNDWDIPNSRIINIISKCPPVELGLQYNITDNFSVYSGIGYVNYLVKWKEDRNNRGTPMGDFVRDNYWRGASIQIPCNIRYNVPLKNTGFSIYSKVGFSMDFLVNSVSHSGGFGYDYSYPNSNLYPDTTIYRPAGAIGDYSRNRKFNLLINAGVGFAYQFKSGIGLSISSEYNIGTMRIGTLNYNLQLKDVDTDIVNYEFDYWVQNRNEYWNVLLGVTYTLKNKKQLSEKTGLLK